MGTGGDGGGGGGGGGGAGIGAGAGGAVVVLVIVGFLWYRKRKASELPMPPPPEAIQVHKGQISIDEDQAKFESKTPPPPKGRPTIFVQGNTAEINIKDEKLPRPPPPGHGPKMEWNGRTWEPSDRRSMESTMEDETAVRQRLPSTLPDQLPLPRGLSAEAAAIAEGSGKRKSVVGNVAGAIRRSITRAGSRGSVTITKPPPSPEKQFEHSKKTLNICKEMRETEKTYINDLQCVLEVFVRPSIQQGILSIEETQAIFANLEELCRCAVVLSELMNREGDPATVLARAFIQVTPFFKLYALYCRNFDNSMKKLQQCQKSVKGFDKFLMEQAMNPKCRGRRLPDFLIMPVQRLTKYPLFWKDLLKAVPHTHPQRASLEKADELVRSVSMAVNQTLADEVARLKTVQIIQDLGNDMMCLVAPHRAMILEFTAVIHSGLKKLNMTGYIFTDLLLLCQVGRGGRQTPWLLVEIFDVQLTSELATDHMMNVGLPGAGGSIKFSAQPPADVEKSRLLNLRVWGEEEYWMELPNEAKAYEVDETISELTDSGMSLATSTRSRSTDPIGEQVDELVVTLKEKRLGRRAPPGGSGGRASLVAARRSARMSRFDGRSSTVASDRWSKASKRVTDASAFSGRRTAESARRTVEDRATARISERPSGSSGTASRDSLA